MYGGKSSGGKISHDVTGVGCSGSATARFGRAAAEEPPERPDVLQPRADLLGTGVDPTARQGQDSLRPPPGSSPPLGPALMGGDPTPAVVPPPGPRVARATPDTDPGWRER